MLFQRKKKKQLWRLASKNENSPPNNVSKSQLTDTEQNADNSAAARLRLSKNSSCSCVELETECPNCSTPPPPYDCIDFNETPFSSVSNLICDQRECNFGETSYQDIRKSGVNFHKYSYTTSDDVADDECDPYDIQSILENAEDSQPIALKKTKLAEAERKTKTPIQIGEAAINIFRFCYTCGSQSRSSSNSSLNKSTLAEKTPLTASPCESLEAQVETNKDFKLLMKSLKNYQISLLLEAVEFRNSVTPTTSKGVGEYLNCILMKRSLWENEEPFLATCRLFFWSDLKTSKDIKRTPLCKSEHNKDSVCCNPLHWCRIILKDGDSPTLDLVDDLYAKKKTAYSKSYTTHNESISTLKKGWCEVAYWELTRRVGLRQVIKCNNFNICHEDNPVMMDSQNVCLKTFFNSYKSAGNDVRIIRQRIGYGVSISKEEDGIWLYNISSVPIFLHSPTLCESWFRVLKVLPGNCVKAFDYFGPVEFSCQMQLPTLEVGPYETRTIRFSFVKGWGRGYKRQDITRCPCWLEIFIKDRP